MKKFKKYYKLIIVVLVLIIFVVLGVFIYKNLFQGSGADRLENVENYKLTKKEKNKVKDKINELSKIENIKVYTNNKIIKIFIELEEDIDFDDVKDVSNELIECFSSDNLKFYDLEIFITSKNKESEVYPKIGYKHKSDSKFTWNR